MVKNQQNDFCECRDNFFHNQFSTSSFYVDCEITDMAINIFLEYVPGGSIYSVLAKAGRFPDPLVRSLSFQILNGLDYLHSV